MAHQRGLCFTLKKENRLRMKLDKKIIVEFVDEDISKLLEEESEKKFISELKSF